MPKVAAANIQRTLQGSEFRHRFAGRPAHIRCGSFAVDLACVGDGWSLKAPASPGLFSKGFRWNCQRQLHAQRRQSARGARQRGPNPHSALPRVMQGHLTEGAASVGGLFVWRYQMRAASVQNLSVPIGFTQCERGTLRHPDSRRKGLGISLYLATAANAFDHAVKRRVLAIDWIVRITHQVLLRGHLIRARLAVPDRRLRQQLPDRVRR
jgi:hypothetical protein